MTDRIYAVTESGLSLFELKSKVSAALNGGIRFIQLREKDISEREYTERARAVKELCRAYGAKLVINDSVRVCFDARADGVHLGQSDGAADEARKILGKDAIIGVTAKTPEQAEAAARAGADYIGCGAVFGTFTKPDAVSCGLSGLRLVTAAAAVPVYAIGGINISNIGLLKDTGAYGAAVVAGLFKGDAQKNAAELVRAADEIFR